VINLAVSSPQAAAAVEHWYRHRTQVEKHPRRQARRRPSSPSLRLHQHCVDAGALLAANIAGWLHRSPPFPNPAGGCSGMASAVVKP
jgi:hypothetical protein